MTDHELKILVQSTARETAREVLRGLGIDVDHPIETQSDFQALREFRVTMLAARKKIVVTTIGVLIAGLLAAAWIGVKYYLYR